MTSTKLSEFIAQNIIGIIIAVLAFTSIIATLAFNQGVTYSNDCCRENAENLTLLNNKSSELSKALIEINNLKIIVDSISIVEPKEKKPEESKELEIEYFDVKPSSSRYNTVHRFTGNFKSPIQEKVNLRGYIYSGTKDNLKLVSTGLTKTYNPGSSFFDYSITTSEFLKGSHYIKFIYNDKSVSKMHIF